MLNKLCKDERAYYVSTKNEHEIANIREQLHIKTIDIFDSMLQNLDRLENNHRK